MNYTFYALSNASKMLAALLPNADDQNVIAPESMVAKAANAAGWGYLVNGHGEQFPYHVVQCPSPPFSGYPASPDTDAGVLQYGDDVNISAVDRFSHKLCELSSDASSTLSPAQIAGVAAVAFLWLMVLVLDVSPSAKHSLTNWCGSFSRSNHEAAGVPNEATPLNEVVPGA